MALHDARKRVAKAMSGQARRHVDRDRRSRQLGRVVITNPLTVDLFDSKMQLREGETLIIGAWFRNYRAKFGIDVGSTLSMQRLSGHWVVHDVLDDQTGIIEREGHAH